MPASGCRKEACAASLLTQVLLQNEKLASTLVGMHTPELVEQNVRTFLQALGLEKNLHPAAEEATLQYIEAVLLCQAREYPGQAVCRDWRCRIVRAVNFTSCIV